HVAQAVDAGREVRVRRIEERRHDSGALAPGTDLGAQPWPPASRARIVGYGGDLGEDWNIARGFEVATRVDTVVSPVAREAKSRAGRGAEGERQRQHDERPRRKRALVRHVRLGQ